MTLFQMEKKNKTNPSVFCAVSLAAAEIVSSDISPAFKSDSKLLTAEENNTHTHGQRTEHTL